MLFNSFEFLLLFLPAAFAGALVAQRVGGWALKAWLSAASLVFYAFWSTSFVWILLASISVNYLLVQGVLGAAPGSSRRLAIATLGIVGNLCLLGWFKFAGFLAFNFNALTSSAIDLGQIILPLGISFFTFQKIGLLVDAQRGDIDEVSFMDYLTFVTFFPQLIAGPIVLFPDVHDQLRTPGLIGIRTERVQAGLSLFALGLAKKTLIADAMAAMATPVFNAAQKGTSLSFAEGWTGALAYSFQIYFDFSGYSDMAIGLAWMFGIALPFNFNSPYKSTSIIDFWHRWHITLSRFLRSYLYFPLGGNRKGPRRRLVNLMAVMLLGGLWHGAAWTFVAWGVLHGLYLVVNHLWRDLPKAWMPPVPAWAAKAAAWAVTFLAVVVAWVLFRADSFAAAQAILAAMADVGGIKAMLKQGLPEGTMIPNGAQVVPWLAGALAVALVLPNTHDLLGSRVPTVGQPLDANRHWRKLDWRPTMAWAGYVAACLAGGILSLSQPQVFIYFQF
ncbi:hypothetical protein A6A04_03710 [Paramagnetospirillum marisnigri]|uniref:Probable alginate O-acetylase AlgI n=1 Tax=Paramagnetospirillum marisnigri TaxID=1285242 RepID=A0A178MKH4_9PROT|nr:MBOAT family O-acyltransferase [Paramagnetospirillum marisnigri]OAN49231.1 hypothetical protein A6A04_03710 [Paramagnetospirillum marisnigri]